MRSTLVLSDVGDETWGAVLESGRVVELHVENSRRPGIAGNIYKGRVSRVLPGMQSAFIDVGIERGAFLHVSDLPAARGADLDFESEEGEPDESAEAHHGIETLETAIERRAISGQAPAAVRPPSPPIQDLLREGQEILVQVSKEPIAAKGARVTAQIALPGRVMVHLPFLERVFVSRRIGDPDERDRLKVLAEKERRGSGGWIVRTAAEDARESVIERDAAYLRDRWKTIQDRERSSGAPVLLHADLDLAERLLRDVLSEEFGEVVVDSERLLRIATDFVERYLHGLGVRVREAGEGWALFDELGIHQEIELALKPRIWLKTGGSIVVNQTEALVAIDVNTGKYVGRKGLEETALLTNLEAVREIVRLLRLRDLGGIIVIDFIDMIEEKNRETLSLALHEELRKDRSRTRLLAMSDFGLVQLTRKRTRRSLDRTLQISCPACDGGGRIRSPMALYYQIQREIARGATLAGPDGPLIRLHPITVARLEEEGLRFRMPPRSGVGGPPSDGPPSDRPFEPHPEEGASSAEGYPAPTSNSAAAPRVQADPALSQEGYEIVW